MRTTLDEIADGIFRILEAISFFANSRKINDLSGGLFSNHMAYWGIWDLLIAAAAILAGMSILSGGVYGGSVTWVTGRSLSAHCGV